MSIEHEDSKGFSDAEFRNRLKLYQKFAKTPEDSFKLQKLEKDYLKEVHKKNEDRNKRYIHYSMGTMKNLNHSSIERHKYDEDRQDQNSRDLLAKESKSVYKKNSLSKSQNLKTNFKGISANPRRRKIVKSRINALCITKTWVN